MSLEIGGALRRGFVRTTARNGITLLVAYAVYAVVGLTLAENVLYNVGVLVNASPPPPAVRLPIPFTLLWILGFVFYTVGLGLVTVAVRTFVSHETEEIPDGFYSRMAGAVGNLFVASFFVGVLVAVGTAFLVVPGVFLAVSLVFTPFFIAAEGDNFSDSMSESWEAVKGERLRLLVLLAVLLAVSASLVWVGGAVSTVAGGLLGNVVTASIAGTVSVYTVAATADAYVQIRREDYRTRSSGFSSAS